MSNPFGMAEVSVPQLIGLNESMKSNRLEQLYRQKQFEFEQAKMDRQAKADARQDRARELIGQGAKPEDVIAADPNIGFDYAQHASSLDKERRSAAAERANAVGTAALMVSRLPAQQQAQAWDQAIDGLVAQGYNDLLPYKGHYDPTKLPALIAESEKAVGHYMQAENQDRQFGEQQRHNKASEGIAAGNLDLSRKREARVTKWGPQPLIGVMGNVPSSTDDLNY